MKRLIDFLLVFAILAGPGICKGDPVTDGAKYVTEKVTKPNDWLGRKMLKYGFVVSVCATNTLRMHLEAEKFNHWGEAIEDDYHAENLMLVVGYIISGYLTYAVLDRDS
jgi:hypothetical protein